MVWYGIYHCTLYSSIDHHDFLTSSAFRFNIVEKLFLRHIGHWPGVRVRELLEAFARVGGGNREAELKSLKSDGAARPWGAKGLAPLHCQVEILARIHGPAPLDGHDRFVGGHRGWHAFPQGGFTN